MRHRLAPTELCDLQVAVLLVQFLRNSSQPGSCWIIIGEGLRFAQVRFFFLPPSFARFDC